MEYNKYNKEKNLKKKPQNKYHIRLLDDGIIITILNMFQKLEEIFNMLEMGKTFFNSQIEI